MRLEVSGRKQRHDAERQPCAELVEWATVLKCVAVRIQRGSAGANFYT
jgi:hypothetical protein